MNNVATPVEAPSEQRVARLAFRVEGGLWCAYLADEASMKDALFLGSIRVAVIKSPERKEQFMDLMREAVTDALQDIGAINPRWIGPIKAPDYERGGNA